jgi:hypothetical protein
MSPMCGWKHQVKGGGGDFGSVLLGKGVATMNCLLVHVPHQLRQLHEAAVNYSAMSCR